MTVPGGSLTVPKGSMTPMMSAPGVPAPGGSMQAPMPGLMAVPGGAAKGPCGNMVQIPALPVPGGNTLSPMKQYHSVGVLPHATANPIAFGSPIGEGRRSARGSTPPMAALAQPAPAMPKVIARESPLRQTSLGGRSSCPSASPQCTHRDTHRETAKHVDIEVLSSVRRRISVDCAAVQKRGSSASMRDSREELYPQSELLEDVKKTKETTANIQDRMAGLEAILLTKKDEDEVVPQDETAESGECWRRVGRLEGELQQALHQLECRESELKDLRVELQSKDCMIKEMDQKAVEWGKGLANNAEKLEQECSNKVQRLHELELLSESLEHKNQSLDHELATCRDRRNELETLLDESALEVNKIQKRHEEQLEDIQCQLADKEVALQQEQARRVTDEDRGKSTLEANKLQKRHEEQLGAIRNQLANSQSQHRALQQEHRAMQQQQSLQLKEENNERQSELVALEASLELEQAQHSADIEQQQSELEAQRRAFEQEVTEFRARDRSSQFEKDNKKLRETVQEQKRVLSDLESELRQERNMGCLPKPGDYLKMVKQREGEVFAKDNALLKLRNKNLEHSLQICQQAMGKHLPAAAKSPNLGGC